ncbi:MAG: outer rane autotransporter barrel domain protein [Caulobacter sp.]|nr:outer rane autotransporter barrel domain protein [Caulobacter sp.]
MTNVIRSRRPRATALLATASVLAFVALSGQAWAGTVVDNTVETVPGTHPSPFTINSGLTVGVNGTGEFDVMSGGLVNTTNCAQAVIADGATSSASIGVDGVGSLFDNGACGVVVGKAGTGVLAIFNGGQFSNTNSLVGYSTIGSAANSHGTVTINGAGSTWNYSSLIVGGQGHGTVNVQNGGLMTQNNCTTTTLGGTNGVGAVTVTGTGSHWANGGCDIDVGGSGVGTLTVQAGGLVNGVNAVMLGHDFAPSSGTLTISGAGSQVTASSVEVGEIGAGFLAIGSGGHLTNGAGYVGDVSGSSGVVQVDGVGSVWTNTSFLQVGKNGAGSLTVNNGGVVTSTTGSLGGGALSTLALSNGGKWQMSGTFTAASQGQADISVHTGSLLSDNGATVASGTNSQSTVNIDGAGSLWTNTGSTSFGGGFNSAFSMDITNGGGVSDTTGDLQSGVVTVDGAGSVWTNSGNLKVGSGGSGTLSIQNGGVASAGAGAGVVTLGASSSSHGILVIGGSGASAQAPGTLQAGSVVLNVTAGGTSLLRFFHTSSNYVFAAAVSGAGGVQQRAGTTVLTAANTYTGNTTVFGGTLLVNGSLASGFTSVQTGGTLGGSGSIGGSTSILAGGHLSGIAGQTLTTGPLSLVSGSLLDVALGAPSSTRLFNVNGNLILDGTLNVTDAGGFGAGVYRLIDYSGVLTDNGLDIGTTPAGVQASSLAVQTGVAGQVNLVYSAGAPLQYWDGAGVVSNNAIDGGTGTWKIGTTNWTDATGATNGGWTGGMAIFQGPGGTITIDNSGGAVSASSIQFASTNYQFQGAGAVTLTGAGGIIRVGDGTAAGANFGTTINVPILGTVGLTKTDLGRLQLLAGNTYTGNTIVQGGTLSVNSDGSLGALSNDLILNGGNFFVGQSVTTNRHVDIQAAATLSSIVNTTLNLTGQFTGTGQLTKAGVGTLTLSGVGSGYTGSIFLNAGTMQINTSLASGAISVVSGSTLGGTGSINGTVTLNSGSTLKGVAGQTFTMGALNINTGSVLDVTLGAPSATRLFNDTGSLVLDGVVNVTNGGAFGPGLYRLIDYAGPMTDNGLDIGTTPAGTPAGSLTIQTSVAHQVNLIYSSSGPITFWNGSTLAPTGTVVGGAGTWKNGPTNWTDANGTISGAWTNGLGIFAGASANVTVDNSGGAVSATDLQFAVSGYLVNGAPLTLTGANATIRVGDGTAGGAAYIAQIDAVLAGNARLIKTDLGELRLSGVNTYTGGATINAGTVVVNADSALGGAAGNLVLNGGGLRATGSFVTGRDIDIQSDSILTTAGGVTLTETGHLTGTGGLAKNGAGTLVLNGVSSYTGFLDVNAGRLTVNGTLAAISVSVFPNSTLSGTGTLSGITSIGSNAHLEGVAGQTLTFGSLTLLPTANIDVTLGAPSNSALFTVTGGIQLDGILNITNAGAFGPGMYRLFDYGGGIFDGGLQIGTTPAGVLAGDLSIQTSIAQQVNLVYAAPGALDFWNGTTLVPAGTVNGGAGTWKLGIGNWSDAAGAHSGSWSGGFGIFSGFGGTVVIDNSAGAVTATGIQVAVQNYTFDGGTLTLTGPNPIFRVGDGTVNAPGVTVNATIAGTNGLIKTDAGGLFLAGVNTYTGGTTIQGGSIQITSDAGLGAASGGVTFQGGLLRVNTMTTGRTFTFDTVGTILTPTGATYTINGALEGTGILIKSSPGTLVLAGGGGYTGDMTVQAGALQVDGSTQASTLEVQSGATLQGTGALTGVVTIDDGAHLKGAAGQDLDTGELILSDASKIDVTLGAPSASRLFNVTGPLTLDGQLNITDGGGFGVGLYRLIDYTGALTDNGLVISTAPGGTPAGALSIQTSVAGQVNLIYGAGSPIQFWNGVTTAPTGQVEGGAGTWKQGTSNWSDANGVTSAPWGGTDAVFAGAAGVVTIDNSAGAIEATSLQFAANGYSVTGGALNLAGASPTLRVGDGTAGGAAITATIGSVLTGSTGLTKTDLGTLVLSGVNTYTGGTTILGGTVSVGANTGLGAVAGGVTFDGGGLTATAGFAASRALTFTGAGVITTNTGVVLDLSGPLSGAGGFTKSGVGTVKLSGNSAAYAGLTTVAGGTLQANGVLGGTVLVASGGRLQGIGQVGAVTVASGGTLSPGNSIGTLTVAGPLTFAAGSTYEVELNAAGQSDLTHATGAATLNGTVNAIPAAGLYALGTRYTIVTADLGRSGTFSGLTGGTLSQPFLKLSLAYDPTHAFLDVTRSALSFCGAAVTANQCAAGTGAESLGQGNLVYNTVANLPDLATIRLAFDGLSGEVHAQTRGIAIEDSRFVRDAALGRMSTGGDGRQAWGQVFGAQGSADGDGNAGKLTRTTDGFLMGVDAPAGDHWRLGVLGGYSQTRFKVDNRASSGDTDNYHVGAYGSVEGGQLSARFGGAYAWHDTAATRSVGFGGFGNNAGGGRATTGQLFGEVAWRGGSDSQYLEPFAGVALVSVHTSAFTEQGGAAALKGLSDTSQTTFTTIGLRGLGTTRMGEGSTLTFKGTIAWRGASGDVTPTRDLVFASGGTAFTVAGAPIAKSALVIDADVSMAVSERARLSFSYQGQMGDGVRDNSLKASLTIGF